MTLVDVFSLVLAMVMWGLGAVEITVGVVNRDTRGLLVGMMAIAMAIWWANEILSNGGGV